MITFGFETSGAAPAVMPTSPPFAVDYGLPPPADTVGRTPSSPLFTAIPTADPTRIGQHDSNAPPSRPGFLFTVILVGILVVFAFRRR